jgi:hypothetical protein
MGFCDILCDNFCDTFESVKDVIVENPGKSLAIVAATVATGGIAMAAAPAIASSLGAAGVLGAAGTGAEISGLSGICLSNASLAYLGGGTVAAGGGGMAGGVAAVTTTGSITGAAVSSTVAANTGSEKGQA